MDTALRCLETDDGRSTITALGPVTVPVAAELRESLLAGFERSPVTVLDLSQATEIDLSALQVLFAAHRWFLREGKTLEIVGAGSGLRETIAKAGFRQFPGACFCGSDGCIWCGAD